MAKDQMTSAQNTHVIYGKLEKIAGSNGINASALNSATSITGLCDWQTAAQSRYLIIVAGTKIYSDLNLGVTPSDISGSATITTGANNQHTFASLNNILAICGGTTPDTPLQWTGSGNVASLAGSPPAGNIVATSNNFMFISGIAATPSRVFWSNVGDPGTWTNTNYVDFRLSDGDIVTALVPFNFNLLIFKRRSAGILYTQTTTTSGGVNLGPLTQLPTSIGCAGAQAWDLLPDGRVIFLSSSAHVYIFDGSSFEDISDPTPPASNIQPNLDALNVGRLPFAVLRCYSARNQIWLAVSTGANTTNDSIYIFDYNQMTWQSVIPDRAANVMATSLDTRSTPKHPILILTGNYGGFVYEHDTGNTNAENADGHIDGYGTVSIPLGGQSTEFIPRSIRSCYEAQTVGQLQLGWGFNGLTDVNQTTTLLENQGGGALDTNFFLDMTTLAGPSTLFNITPIASNARTYTVQVQYRNQFASQDFTVHPLLISDEVIA